MTSTKTAIEIFLFINPLEMISYQLEKMVVEFSKERNETVHVRFIPLLNFHTVTKQLSNTHLKGTNLTLRNDLYSKTYHVSLAFEAAMMQGKKAGRTFLIALQDALLIQKMPLSKQVILDTALHVGLDMEMFEEDLACEDTKEAFLEDQQLARDMNVHDTPSCLIYNGNEDSYGCLIDTNFTKPLLHGICNMDLTDEFMIQEIKQKYNFDFL